MKYNDPEKLSQIAQNDSINSNDTITDPIKNPITPGSLNHLNPVMNELVDEESDS